MIAYPDQPAKPLAERPFVTSKDFLAALRDAGLLPQWPNLTRVVIDADMNSPIPTVRMYVEQIPSGALLTVAPLMRAPEEQAGGTVIP